MSSETPTSVASGLDTPKASAVLITGLIVLAVIVVAIFALALYMIRKNKRSVAQDGIELDEYTFNNEGYTPNL